MSAIDWHIQDYTLGGLIAKRTINDLVMGFNSKLIQNMPFQVNSIPAAIAAEPWNYYYFKTGDAIEYDAKI